MIEIAQMKTKTLESQQSETLIGNVFQIVGGCLFMILVSQIVVPLPFTPVPITGQTLGVASLSLGLGKHKSVISLGLYLLLAALGFPILAAGKILTFPGPTVGYLIGMVVSAYFIGSFKQSNWRTGFLRTYLVILFGSIITFLFGLIGLSFYVPMENLLMMGLYPFLIGDFIKTILVAAIFSSGDQK
jgi:biotin transport system substrate-specific component